MAVLQVPLAGYVVSVLPSVPVHAAAGGVWHENPTQVTGVVQA